MPLFRYRAWTAAGKRVRGVIDADSAQLAVERLGMRNLLVRRLDAARKQRREAALSASLLLAFTRDLRQLLLAGLPLYECLLSVEEKYRNQRSHPLFLDLCDRLKGGSSFYLVLKAHSNTFDAIYLAMVATGERTGSLPNVFDQLCSLLERQQRIKKQLMGALTYPLLLTAVCGAVLGTFLFVVIPSLKPLFEGRSVQSFTRCILSLSDWVTSHSGLLCTCLLAMAGVVTWGLRQRRILAALHTLCLRMPIVKTLLLQTIFARFCRGMALLLSSGVPILEALALSRSGMRSPPFEALVESAEKGVMEGKSLSEQLKASAYVPKLMVRMLATAEQVGQLDRAFHNLATIYDEDLEKNLLQMTTLLQPLMLIVLGAVVGLVILSILLPLTDVSSFLNS